MSIHDVDTHAYGGPAKPGKTLACLVDHLHNQGIYSPNAILKEVHKTFGKKEQSMTKTLNDITREQAIAYGKSRAWEGLTARQKAEFQMESDRQLMPFEVFHEALEETLGRPVFTHELGSQGLPQLQAELYDGADPPTLQDLLDTLPEGMDVVLIKG